MGWNGKIPDIHRMKQFASIFLVALLFSSCQGYTDREWSVANNSTVDIIVQFDANVDSYSSETFLPSGEKEVIGLENDEADQAAGSPTDAINNMRVFAGADTITKDYSLPENWTVSERSSRSNQITYVFTLEVSDDDF